MKLRWAVVCVGFLALTSKSEAQWLYFTDNNGSDSGIARWNLGVPGSQPEFLVTAHQLDLMGYGPPYGAIAVDPVAGKFYFFSDSPGPNVQGAIFRANLDGTQLEPIHSLYGWAVAHAMTIYRPPGNVPAVTTWGLVALGLAVLVAASVLLRQRLGHSA